MSSGSAARPRTSAASRSSLIPLRRRSRWSPSACLGLPFVAGIFLALSVATVFYPLFFIPAWIGYYWHKPGAVVRFVAGMAVAAIVVGGPVLARSRPIEGHTLIGTIVRETIGHHQGARHVRATPFGFWGERGGIRAWLQQELVPGQAVSTPMFS